jgi:hypothetical protein
MKNIILIAVIAVASTSCTNKEGAAEALKDAGYHPIKVGGYAFFGCGEEDVYRTNFEAYSSDSTRIVTGQVCEGLLKGKTIRID